MTEPDVIRHLRKSTMPRQDTPALAGGLELTAIARFVGVLLQVSGQGALFGPLKLAIVAQKRGMLLVSRLCAATGVHLFAGYPRSRSRGASP